MQRIVEGYFQLLKFAIVACLALMVVLVFGNVVLRYAFNLGITVSEELSRFLFVWLTFLGAIIAFREHGHLGVDMVVSRLPAVGKKACLIVSQVLMLFVTWLFLQGSWQQTMINLDVKSPSAGMSMGLFYGVGIVFSVSVGVILLHDLYRRGHGPDVRGGAGDGQGIGGAGGARGAAEGARRPRRGRRRSADQEPVGSRHDHR